MICKRIIGYFHNTHAQVSWHNTHFINEMHNNIVKLFEDGDSSDAYSLLYEALELQKEYCTTGTGKPGPLQKYLDNA